jgi:hypothetical protein
VGGSENPRATRELVADGKAARLHPAIQKCINLQEDEDPDTSPLRYFSKLGALDRYIALAGVSLGERTNMASPPRGLPETWKS